MATIYGLASTQNGIIRYVGEDGGNAGQRAKDHYSAGSKSVRCVIKWARQTRWLGYDIYSLEIERCLWDERWDREDYWIDRIPNLINERKNYHRWRELRTSEDKKYIEKLQDEGRPEFVENWNGFVGVRYYPWLEAWQVHLQAQGYRHHWLTETDGGPVTMIGRTQTWRRKIYHVGDDYFMDPNNAIEARRRERERYYPSSQWPPDKNPFSR